MTAFNKRSARERDIEERYPDSLLLRNSRWSDRVSNDRPVTARQDLDGFEAVSSRPANDDARRTAQSRVSPNFIGSRYFWAATGATVVFCALFALLAGFRTPAAIASLFYSPGQYSPFFLALVVIGGLQWLLAMSAHRQAVQNEMWRRVLSVTQRLNDPTPMAEEANWKLNTTFDRLFADLDARMAALDEKTVALSGQMTELVQQSSATAEDNMGYMRSIVDTMEVQRDALQRSSVMITTEIMPVISKLESTVQSLEVLSQGAGGILDGVGSNLQQSTSQLQSCLDDFNRANHTVAPEIEKRLHKLEAAITRLPDQLDQTLTRLTPLSETISDAAMLSTANIDVIEHLSQEISSSLQKSRALFTDFASSSKELFQTAVESQVDHFRGMLDQVVAEEAGRLSSLSRELELLADTAAAVVDRLQQPVANIAATADRALSNINESVESLDERIHQNLASTVSDLNEAASRVVSLVSRELESTTIALQTRLAASSNDLVQRVNIDAARFENLIADVAQKTSGRVSTAIKDLPAVLSQRMEGEIAKIDGSLKGSIVGLSDQMRTIIDGIPSRLNSMTRETLQSLEGNLERSFEGVAQRSERLNEEFRKNATETADAVLGSYVDFIFLALERFRAEVDRIKTSSGHDMGVGFKTLQKKDEPITLDAAE